jgi:hypothetical protein
MQKYEGMPFAVEWQGKVVTIFIALTVIEDLGGHQSNTTQEAYLQTFERHRGEILDAITLAITDPENFDGLGRLYIRQKDLDFLKQGQWYRVSIDTGEDIRVASVTGLMNKFVETFISSGLPSDVQVFRDLTIIDAHVYYFSPRAAVIANDLLASHGATPCAKPLHLASMRKVKF